MFPQGQNYHRLLPSGDIWFTTQTSFSNLFWFNLLSLLFFLLQNFLSFLSTPPTICLIFLLNIFLCSSSSFSLHVLTSFLFSSSFYFLPSRPVLIFFSFCFPPSFSSFIPFFALSPFFFFLRLPSPLPSILSFPRI